MTDQREKDVVVVVATPLSRDSLSEADAETHSSNRTLDFRLLPILCWLAFVTTIATTTFGRAQVTGMERDLKLEGRQYNISIVVYFLPIILLDVPATLMFYASQPACYMAGFVCLLGIVTICEGLTHNFAGLVTCRLFLGICEMAFQVGGILLIVIYYPQRCIQTRIGFFIMTRLVASAFGGLLSFGIAHMQGIAGYSAWRWIFIFTGLLNCVSAPVALLLPKWHQDQSTSFFVKARSRVLSFFHKDSNESSSSWTLVKECLQNPIVYFGALIHFCCVTAASSNIVFMPTILRELGWSPMKALYMEIPIHLTTAIVTWVVCVASDRTRHRSTFCIGFLALAAVGYSILLSGSRVSIAVRYGACYVLSSGYFVAQVTSIAWLSNNICGLRRRGIALGIAAGIANCGAILGSNVYTREQAPRYPTGFGVCLAMIVLGICIAAGQIFYMVWNSKRRVVSEHNDDFKYQY